MVRSKQNKQDSDYKRCLKCDKKKKADANFYKSNSSNHHDGRYPICKPCIRSSLNITEETDFFNDDFLDVLQNTLLEMNRPFIYSLYSSTVEEHKRTHKEFFGLYIKNVLLNFQTLTWKESEFHQRELAELMESKKDTEDVSNVGNPEDEPEENIQVLEDKNKQDVLRMLGYDPFEFESVEDKRHLYNKLVDFLDDSTLEDSFKLPAVIEIVKAFNQIDKINIAISKMVKSLDSGSAGGVKSLIDSKEKMLKSILALAKDNGISVNYNNNKSKGSGTLSGIIKQLQERGFEEASVNRFDVETAQGIRQVADLSNDSIMKQLQFDENDYTQMILEQREMLQELDEKVIRLEEENRKLKKELISVKQLGDGHDD